MYQTISSILMGGHNLVDERRLLSKILDNVSNSLYGGDMTTSKEMHKTDDEFNERFYQSLKDNPDLLEELNRLRKENSSLKKENKELKKKPRKTAPSKSLERYDQINFKKFLKTQDGKLIQEQFSQYDDELTAFDRNSKIEGYFRDYQFNFIKDWSISAQELVLLYYGLGSGKTVIAINCAEQFSVLNNDATVYFLVPASLVLNTIGEMYKHGINPDSKLKNGKPRYYFVSYQQLLRSSFDFEDDSLLILDEAHNLRNLRTMDIYERVSARRTKKTDNYSLLGNKLAEKLIFSSANFLRSIFMTGTLFVNTPADIETIISIGYKRAPLLNKDKEQYELIQYDPKEFKLYYEGLISFYRIPDDAPQFPSLKYHVIPVEVEGFSKYGQGEDPYFVNSRLEHSNAKILWTIDFLTHHRGEKTLVYSQFLDASIRVLTTALKKLNIKFGVIDGSLSQTAKMDVKNQYNNDEITLLIFTLSIKEGISFKETKNFIALEPYWNYSIFEQVLARAIRLDSHKKGKQSLLNIYLLVTTDDTKNQWFEDVEKMMNTGIKRIKFDTEWITEKDKEGKETKKLKKISKLGESDVSIGVASRDMDLYQRMIRKQEEINVFEEKILAIPKFEEVNNIENNEFIEEYNATVLRKEHEENRVMSFKEKILLKKSMYADYYSKNIRKIDDKFTKFAEDTRYRANRNPNLEEIADHKEYPNKEDMIRNLLKKNASINDIFEAFNITKTEITSFQANFTPESHVKELINFSEIEKDLRKNIKILEPTAGIGGIISQLIKLPNNYNFMVDCNELHKIFFQVGQTIFENIENVKWYNYDFNDYRQKYNYDYILGNPPFNLRTQVKHTKRRKGSKIPEIIKVDTTLYDIDFVAKAYDMLNEDGMLCFIISDRFQRDKSYKFSLFNKYLDELREEHENYVQIKKVEHSFREDKNITKKMETSFGMVMIRLIKLQNFSIDVDRKEKKKRQEENAENEEKEEEPQPEDDEFEVKPKRKTTKKTKKTTKKTTEEPQVIEEPNPPEPEPKPEPKKKKKVWVL